MSHVPRALVVLAEGAEEMEVVITVDVLRRAGVDVWLAGLDGPGVVTCSRKVRLAPDAALAETQGPWDAVVLPGGGEGTRRLAESAVVGELVRGRALRGELVGAICAAPRALAEHDAFAGFRMTCHPSVHDVVSAHGELAPGQVVEDRHLVTAPGPGASFDFALALVARLRGPDVAARITGPMMLPEPPEESDDE